MIESKLYKKEDNVINRDYHILIKEFYKTIKAKSFYPPSHPSLYPIVDRFFKFLKVMNENYEEVKINIDKKGFYYKNQQIMVDSRFLSLSTDLSLKRIESISFLKNLTIRDLYTFLDLIIMEPKDIREKGGIEKLIVENGIKSIKLEETPLEEIIKGRMDMRDRKRAQDGTLPGSKSGIERDEKVKVFTDVQEEILTIQKDIFEKEENLSDLLRMLNKDIDIDRYRSIVNEIISISRTLLYQKNYDKLLIVFKMLLKHLYSNINEDKKGLIKKAINVLSDEGMILYLLNRISLYRGLELKLLSNIFIVIGEKAIPYILNAITKSNRLSIRRKLISLMVAYGDPAIPYLKEKLKDERWFVLRNMLTIIGDIGKEEVISDIEHFIKHEDFRVRKEAIRAIAKIKGDKALSILLSLINDKDISVRLQAIFSLGILKDERVLPILINIAKKRAIFIKDFILKREAIASIGRVGSKDAIPYLAKILNSKIFIRKKRNYEIKLKAALALKDIGGEEAINILLEGIESKNYYIKLACKEALYG
jgi:hypothetical protein